MIENFHAIILRTFIDLMDKKLLFIEVEFWFILTLFMTDPLHKIQWGCENIWWTLIKFRLKFCKVISTSKLRKYGIKRMPKLILNGWTR